MSPLYLSGSMLSGSSGGSSGGNRQSFGFGPPTSFDASSGTFKTGPFNKGGMSIFTNK